MLRYSSGGGNRVSAVTLDADAGDLDPGDLDQAIAEAEVALRTRGQAPLFMIRPGEAALDAALEARGYALADPTAILAAQATALAPGSPDPGVIRCARPLAVQRELWCAFGIDEARQAACDRVVNAHSFLIARVGDRVEAAGFVAQDGPVAMLHALVVAPSARRQGLGGRLTRTAAAWAVSVGAQTLALAVTKGNAPARGLYSRLGMAEATAYHYRRAPLTNDPARDP